MNFRLKNFERSVEWDVVFFIEIVNLYHSVSSIHCTRPHLKEEKIYELLCSHKGSDEDARHVRVWICPDPNILRRIATQKRLPDLCNTFRLLPQIFESGIIADLTL